MDGSSSSFRRRADFARRMARRSRSAITPDIGKSGSKSSPALRGDWDEVAQWYLATTAWHQALREEHLENQKSGDAVKSGEREAVLRECQAALEKIRGQLDSPIKFDPTDEAFQDEVKRLLQQLAKLEG